MEVRTVPKSENYHELTGTPPDSADKLPDATVGPEIRPTIAANNGTEATESIPPRRLSTEDQGPQTFAEQRTDREGLSYSDRCQRIWNLLQVFRVKEAEEQLRAIAASAKTADDKKYHDELCVLTHYVGEFAKGFENGDRRLKPNSEMMVDGKPILFRDRTGTDYTFRSQGRNLRIPREKLPPRIRIAIADLWFDPNDPAVSLAKAASYSLHPVRNQERMEYWCSEAMKQGDVENSMKVRAVYSRFHP